MKDGRVSIGLQNNPPITITGVPRYDATATRAVFKNATATLRKASTTPTHKVADDKSQSKTPSETLPVPTPSLKLTKSVAPTKSVTSNQTDCGVVDPARFNFTTLAQLHDMFDQKVYNFKPEKNNVPWGGECEGSFSAGVLWPNNQPNMTKYNITCHGGDEAGLHDVNSGPSIGKYFIRCPYNPLRIKSYRGATYLAAYHDDHFDELLVLEGIGRVHFFPLSTNHYYRTGNEGLIADSIIQYLLINNISAAQINSILLNLEKVAEKLNGRDKTEIMQLRSKMTAYFANASSVNAHCFNVSH